jgi:hypothetical protein
MFLGAYFLKIFCGTAPKLPLFPATSDCSSLCSLVIKWALTLRNGLDDAEPHMGST